MDLDKPILEQILHRVTEAVGVVERIEPVTGGFSSDRKFTLWRRGEPAYILRVAPGADPVRRAEEFHWIGVHHANGVLCPQPRLFGSIEGTETVFCVLDYLPGEAASAALPALPAARQREIGVAAGRQLRKMHAVKGTEKPREWRARIWRKYERYLSLMRRANIVFEGLKTVEAYTERNRDILVRRPVRFQHDDFHLDNIIVRDGRFAGTIDFNRFDWGDPWQDFYKVAMFTAPLSPSFARGQVLGYFNGRPPETFWPVYNLYVAMAVVFSLGWATLQPNLPVPFFRETAKEILSGHDFAFGGPPVWYSSG